MTPFDLHLARAVAQICPQDRVVDALTGEILWEGRGGWRGPFDRFYEAGRNVAAEWYQDLDHFEHWCRHTVKLQRIPMTDEQILLLHRNRFTKHPTAATLWERREEPKGSPPFQKVYTESQAIQKAEDEERQKGAA